MTIDLRGQVALITGSARRIGQNIAMALAQQGCDIAIHYSNSSSSELAHEAASYLAREFMVNTMVVHGDLTKVEDILEIFDAIDQRFERLDILVNNAASFNPNFFDTMPLAEWENTLRLNLTAPMLCTQEAMTLMKAYDISGSIINILDTTAIRGRKTMPAHSVSKAALNMLTQVTALCGAPKIRVNSLVLGPMLQDASMSDDDWWKLGMSLPLRRTGKPEDVGAAVVFLAQNDFITGSTLTVDGGESLKR